MNKNVSIDLKSLPLQTRNKIVNLVKKSNSYYTLVNQVISSDFNTMCKIMKEF